MAFVQGHCGSSLPVRAIDSDSDPDRVFDFDFEADFEVDFKERPGEARGLERAFAAIEDACESSRMATVERGKSSIAMSCKQ